VLERLRDYQARFGYDFKPAPLLERLAAEGKSFTA
jgi:3-hydroxyacyl-CoA dehydrogenase